MNNKRLRPYLLILQGKIMIRIGKLLKATDNTLLEAGQPEAEKKEWFEYKTIGTKAVWLMFDILFALGWVLLGCVLLKLKFINSSFASAFLLVQSPLSPLYISNMLIERCVEEDERS